MVSSDSLATFATLPDASILMVDETGTPAGRQVSSLSTLGVGITSSIHRCRMRFEGLNHRVLVSGVAVVDGFQVRHLRLIDSGRPTVVSLPSGQRLSPGFITLTYSQQPAGWRAYAISSFLMATPNPGPCGRCTYPSLSTSGGSSMMAKPLVYAATGGSCRSSIQGAWGQQAIA